jgi:nucleoside-diphosphate-sugar epimerase
LYAEDCSAGLEIIMKNHNKFKSANKELHLTTNKNISIIKIAKIIKKIAHLKNINVEILRGKTKDTVQLNKKNKNNNFLNKYWRPKNSINKGILEIFEFYQKNLR